MAKFVMMSMVFAVVLLKSAAMEFSFADDIFGAGNEYKKLDNMEFSVSDKVTYSNRYVKKVTKAAYDACQALTDNEEQTDANGQVNVTFDFAGKQYFISPNPENCNRGLKFSISVSATPGASPSLTPPTTTSSSLNSRGLTTPSDTTGTQGSSSPAVSVGVLVPMMAVVMGFFF